MKLAFSRPTAGIEEQRLLFTRFRAAGFEGLQLKAGQYAGYVSEPERFRQEWGDDPGAVSALICGGTLEEAGIAALRQVIAFAAAVRAERVVFCHGVPRAGLTAADLRGFARLLSGLAREAMDRGTRLSLHHHYDQPVMHRDDFDRFFEAADPEALGLTVDTAHLVKSGIADISGLIRDFRGVIDNIHLKDFARGEFRVLGEGEIDFGPSFGALHEIGYNGWLCADEESGADLEAGMEASARYLRTRLGGATAA
jgi:inosose dehydratase